MDLPSSPLPIRQSLKQFFSAKSQQKNENDGDQRNDHVSFDAHSHVPKL
jgi:hypothetical protein